MYVVHIYIESDSAAQKKSERWTGYVMECEGKKKTVEGFNCHTATYHAAILFSLNEALSRINQSCEVHIHTQNVFILNMIEYRLPSWAGNKFCSRNGEPIKNQDQWKQLWETYKKHLIISEPGIHPYFPWLKDEMKKRKNAAASDKH